MVYDLVYCKKPPLFDYRSSDDEDYVPEGAADEGEEDVSSGDEVEEVNEKDGGVVAGRRRKGAEEEKQFSSTVPPTQGGGDLDVDAIFAAMLEEDEKNVQKHKQVDNTLTETKPQTCADEATTSSGTTVTNSTPQNKNETKTITEVFDFAGEEIRIEKRVTTEEFEKHEHEKKKAEENSVKRPAQKRVGLGDALTLLQKKPKMSVLDKSNHDWSNFKQEHDLQEELQTFNRGKNGYLNKQDFLSRTDVRQFENEKSMRNARRKPPQ